MHKSTAQQRLKPVVQASIDGVIAVAALALAFSLRYEDGLPDRYTGGFAGLLLGVSVGKTLISYFLGNYRRMWRYTSQREVLVLAATAALAALVLVALRLLGPALALQLSYGVIVIDAALLPSSAWPACACSAVARWHSSTASPNKSAKPCSARSLLEPAVPLTPFSATLTTPIPPRGTWWASSTTIPHGRAACCGGGWCWGPTTELERVVRERDVQRVVIAMPSADEGVVRDLSRRARRLDVPVQVMPGFRNLPRGARAASSRGDGAAIRLSDLTDGAEFQGASFLVKAERPDREKPILVTGGAGYIGSHLTRKLLERGHRVRVLDNFTFGERGLRTLKGAPPPRTRRRRHLQHPRRHCQRQGCRLRYRPCRHRRRPCLRP